ncbi:triose-phosphate isomerase [Vallitalea longa]|uniref:Triosephosphate isomerase n=1 Tax=Vallitalea longa TaxID=2936439 RepID=A0A9W6DG30_9FIRM|nr:triose-phosphate isomerase family protein [Vallitalea longa]GKX31876.1 triose-phosphate isomerase [Vallitalea longa]
MKEIFVNLKRFDVPVSLGGICPRENSKEWIEWVIAESIRNNLGTLEGITVTYLLPESLLIPAMEKLKCYEENDRKNIFLGSEGVYRGDVAKGGNFGAFTTNLPAAAVKSMGLSWSIIGHSEERKDKLGIIERFDKDYDTTKASIAVNSMINDEVVCALKQDINVLLCIGETAKERGEGTFEEQKPRIKKVLEEQLELCLGGTVEVMKNNKIVIGYEPIWAIGPGKTPPGKEYIAFVSKCIKDYVKKEFNFDIAVVYGGGLKEENAEMIASIDTINGGLVALTKFVQPVAFEPEGLKNIIKKYC